jgi:hypothetical protein
VESTSTTLQPVLIEEWESEERVIGRVNKSVIDGAKNEEKVFGCIFFETNSSKAQQTELFLLRNEIIVEKNDAEHQTQSGNGEENKTNVLLIFLVVFFAVLFIGAGVVIVLGYMKHRRYVERTEEEKRKRNEWTTKENGMEMIEKVPVWNLDIMGGSVLPTKQLTRTIIKENHYEQKSWLWTRNKPRELL